MILLNRKIHNVVENHTIEIHIRQGMTVNPGLNYFKQCSLACMCLLVNLHLRFVKVKQRFLWLFLKFLLLYKTDEKSKQIEDNALALHRNRQKS